MQLWLRKTLSKNVPGEVFPVGVGMHWFSYAKPCDTCPLVCVTVLAKYRLKQVQTGQKDDERKRKPKA